ncbi:translation elongation factor Ts [Patescibacteria group bacterium]|nr:translation elongation factor Ts [Patescibacteria group bacterium]
MVDIAQLKQLREETDISFAECKKALEEAGGNLERAKEILRERGKEIASKKSSREVGEGLVHAYVHTTGKTGVLVDVRCETDFVARSADFQSIVHEIALQIASMEPETVGDLLEQPFVRDSSKTMKDLVQEAIAKMGENIVVHRFSRFTIP